MTGSSSWIRKEKRVALYIRSGFTCAYCGRDLKDARPEEMGLDHLETLPNGGHVGANNEPSNLVMVCRRCNSQRGNREWRDYAPAGSQDRIEAVRYLPLNMDLARAIIAGTAVWADR